MSSFEHNVHLRDYIKVVSRHKGIALLFFVTVVAIVAVVSFIIDPVYRATTTILIDLETPYMLTATDVATSPQNYYTYKEYFQSQTEIIRGKNIARMVFEEFRIIEQPEYADEKEPLDKFMKTIKVEPVRDTRIARLHVENREPVLAAEIANGIAGLYVEQNLEYITQGEYLNLLKNEYIKLQARLSEYSKVYKHGHPKMIRLKEQIAQMAGRIEAEKNKSVTGFALPQHDVLAEYDGGVSPDVALDGLKANNVRILDRAEPPVVPVRPKKWLNVAVAVLAGLLGAAGLAFFVEYLDITVKSEDDIEGLINIPFLGTIPRIESERMNKRLRGLRKNFVCDLTPNSVASESFKTVRTNILFSSDGEGAVQDFVITSPGQKEGKTTTACNLAITFSKIGQKVLLIDGDLRKPRLHEVFSLDNSKGLGDVMMDGADLVLSGGVAKTDIENLYILPAGPANPRPSETLGSDDMKELINKARKDFDLILIDTPPVISFTDAAILAGFVGGVIIIVEGGRTVRSALSKAERTLRNVKAKITGVIVNKITKRDTFGSYYSKYYYAQKSK